MNNFLENENLTNFIFIILCNIVIFSFLTHIGRNRIIASVGLFFQIFFFSLACQAYYISTFLIFFFSNTIILYITCKREEKKKLQDITEDPTTDKKILRFTFLILCLLGTCNFIFYSYPSSSFQNRLYPRTSLCSDDNCLIFLLALFILLSIIGCLRNFTPRYCINKLDF